MYFLMTVEWNARRRQRAALSGTVTQSVGKLIKMEIGFRDLLAKSSTITVHIMIRTYGASANYFNT